MSPIKESQQDRDKRYRETLLKPLRGCAHYVPAMGGERSGTTLEQFKLLYGSDPFYHWVGIDSDFMYAAHKAAGGMTSVYRQLGTGGERLLRAIMIDELGFTAEQICWSYDVISKEGKRRTLTLDARLDFEHLKKPAKLKNWTLKVAEELKLSKANFAALKGSVFEIRQGYKS
jgi:hypothetical protein